MAVLPPPVVLLKSAIYRRPCWRCRCVVKERSRTDGVLSMPVVGDQRIMADGRVGDAGGVVRRAHTPTAVLEAPVVLLKSARDPWLFWLSPVVLSKNAPDPWLC